jgi:hypothetical protein
MSKRLANKQVVRRRTGHARPRPVVSVRPNRFHAFLKRLRAGGRSNMYGAIPYLMHAFALDRETAFRVVCEWVDREQAERSELPAVVSPRR